MPTIHCDAQLLNIKSWTIVLLPKSASAKLPSRGMNMICGTINGFKFQSALEPDGKGSHWFKINNRLKKMAISKNSDSVALSFEAVKEWPEPKVPEDLKKALLSAPSALAVWKDTTVMARWDWIRWVQSTKVPATRKKHVDVALSKLSSGERRPCCFNRSMCTVPEVSKNGILLDSDSS